MFFHVASWPASPATMGPFVQIVELWMENPQKLSSFKRFEAGVRGVDSTSAAKLDHADDAAGNSAGVSSMKI
jgi:hypothetical protein